MTYEEQLEQIQRVWKAVLIGNSQEIATVCLRVLTSYLEGGGFIQVERGERYDLGPPMTGEVTPGHFEEDLYTISAFHQIHCLYYVYRHWLLLAHGRPATESPHGKDRGHDPFYHVSHCLDYILQAIKCAGDSTLEHFNDEDWDHSSLKSGTLGLGSSHMCKDWDEFTRFPRAEYKKLLSKPSLF
jgi:hypothetical protein